MPTEKVGPFSVTDGEITDHNISDPDGDIRVQSAQIRWRGNTPKTTQTLEYANATSLGERFLTTAPETINLDCPSSPSGTTYSKTVVSGMETLGDSQIELRDPSDGSTVATASWSEENLNTITVSDDRFDGSSIDFHFASSNSNDEDAQFYGLQVRTFGTTSVTGTTSNGTLTSVSNSESITISSDNTTKTVSASYPSVPSNGVFSRHKITISIQNITDNEGDVISYQSDINNDGNIEATRNELLLSNFNFSDVDSNSDVYYIPQYSNGETITCDFTATERALYGSDFNCTLTVETEYIEQTTDPFVTRDVDGSFTGSLTDNEWSPWQPLNNLDSDRVEEFYHNISGSGRADVEFEYEWRYEFPDAVYELRIYDEDSDTTYKVAIADISDPDLNFDSVRTAINDTSYTIDTVKPSDPNAIDWTHIYHPTHGELSLRKFDSV